MRFDLVVNLMTASSFYEKIYILGGGQQIRPLICVDDVTEYLYRISNSKNKNYNNQIFNIGRENLRVIDIARIVKKTLNNNTKLIIVLMMMINVIIILIFQKLKVYLNSNQKISRLFSKTNISKTPSDHYQKTKKPLQ